MCVSSSSATTRGWNFERSARVRRTSKAVRVTGGAWHDSAGGTASSSIQGSYLALLQHASRLAREAVQLETMSGLLFHYSRQKVL